MKKLFAIVAMVAACSFASTSSVMAQEDVNTVDTAAVDNAEANEEISEDEAIVAAEAELAVPVEEEENLHKTLKTKFIEGDAGFM